MLARRGRISMAQTRGVDRHDTVVTGLRRLLDRLDSDALAHQVVAAGERQIPGYARLSEEVRWGPVRTMAREVIEVCRRSVLGSVAPHPDDLRTLEDDACRRAAEGVPLEDVLRAYRLGMRLAWRE